MRSGFHQIWAACLVLLGVSGNTTSAQQHPGHEPLHQAGRFFTPDQLRQLLTPPTPEASSPEQTELQPTPSATPNSLQNLLQELAQNPETARQFADLAKQFAPPQDSPAWQQLRNHLQQNPSFQKFAQRPELQQLAQDPKIQELVRKYDEQMTLSEQFDDFLPKNESWQKKITDLQQQLNNRWQQLVDKIQPNSAKPPTNKTAPQQTPPQNPTASDPEVIEEPTGSEVLENPPIPQQHSQNAAPQTPRPDGASSEVLQPSHREPLQSPSAQPANKPANNGVPTTRNNRAIPYSEPTNSQPDQPDDQSNTTRTVPNSGSTPAGESENVPSSEPAVGPLEPVSQFKLENNRSQKPAVSENTDPTQTPVVPNSNLNSAGSKSERPVDKPTPGDPLLQEILREPKTRQQFLDYSQHLNQLADQSKSAPKPETPIDPANVDPQLQKQLLDRLNDPQTRELLQSPQTQQFLRALVDQATQPKTSTQNPTTSPDTQNSDSKTGQSTSSVTKNDSIKPLSGRTSPQTQPEQPGGGANPETLAAQFLNQSTTQKLEQYWNKLPPEQQKYLLDLAKSADPTTTDTNVNSSGDRSKTGLNRQAANGTSSATQPRSSQSSQQLGQPNNNPTQTTSVGTTPPRGTDQQPKSTANSNNSPPVTAPTPPPPANSWGGDQLIQSLAQQSAKQSARLLRWLAQPNPSNRQANNNGDNFFSSLAKSMERLGTQRGSGANAAIPSLPSPVWSFPALSLNDLSGWWALLALVLLAIAGCWFVQWRKHQRQRVLAQNRPFRWQPWQAKTEREQVERLFEELAIRQLGESALTQHHRQIAQQLAEPHTGSLNPGASATTPAKLALGAGVPKQQAAQALADLYEQARYTPQQLTLPADLRERAQHHADLLRS